LICLKKYRYVILWTVLCILTAVFIFGNSLKSGEESNAISTGLAEKLLTFIDADGNLDHELFHNLLRKAAHFTEFAVLGTFLTLLMFSIRSLTGQYHPAAVFLTVLSAAVTDEFIQIFTGRGSMVSDVLIDFGGGTAAILLVCLIACLIHRKKKLTANE